MHKNATIRGNPALIRPFPHKTPGLLHCRHARLHSSSRLPVIAPRHGSPSWLIVTAPRHGRLDRPSLSIIPLIISTLNDRRFPPRRGNACRLSYWHSGSYASGFCPVIHSHTLEATSLITERLLSVILSASEESVTDPSLHFVPFRMTGSPFPA